MGLRCLGLPVLKHPGTPFTITYRETATFPLSLGRAPLRHLVAELVSLKVDVLVAGSTPAALAVRNATQTIPIVMVGG